jgi:hypothetical protein
LVRMVIGQNRSIALAGVSERTCSKWAARGDELDAAERWLEGAVLDLGPA